MPGLATSFGAQARGHRSPPRHPGVTALLLYYFAFVFGQVLAIPITLGSVATVITLTQVAIIGSIFWFISPRVRARQSPGFSAIATLLILYIISCSLSFMATGKAVNELISMVANILWFLVVGGTLRTGVSLAEWDRLSNGILRISIVPVVCGLIELVTRQPLFTYGHMGRGISDSVFYIRGTHTDKLDFSFEMAFCIFIGVASLLNNARGSKRTFISCVTGVCALLIAFSWSTTGILGLLVGLTVMMMFFRGKGQVVGAVCFVAFLGVGVYSLFSNTSLGEGQKEAYGTKLALETGSQESGVASSFRVLSIEACIAGAIKNPIIGIGFGNQFEYIQEKTYSRKEMNAHTVLSVFLELGFFGGLPFAILIALVCHMAITTTQSASRDNAVLRELGPIIVALTGYTAVRYAFYFHYFNSSQDFIWIALVLMAYGQKRMEVRQVVPPVSGRTGFQKF